MYNSIGPSFIAGTPIYAISYIIYMGGDFFTLWLGTIVLGLFNGLTYYLLSVSIPRTGGDYIYSSRPLHPAAGFLAGGLIGWAWAVQTYAKTSCTYSIMEIFHVSGRREQ
jgi:amino acid transporter